jgi:hypothetical protein
MLEEWMMRRSVAFDSEQKRDFWGQKKCSRAISRLQELFIGACEHAYSGGCITKENDSVVY